MNKINDFLREASANAFEIAASDSNSTKYFSKFQLLSMCISAVFRSYGYEFHQVSAAMAVNTFLDYHKPTCNGVFPVVEYIHPTKQTAFVSFDGYGQPGNFDYKHGRPDEKSCTCTECIF